MLAIKYWLFVFTLISSTCLAQYRLADSIQHEIDQVKQIEQSGEYDLAIIKTEEFLVKYRDNPRYSAYFFIRLGTSFCSSHKCEIGLRYFKKAYTVGEITGDTVLLGKSCLGIGASYHFLEKIDSALYFYSRARPLLKHMQDSIQLVGLDNNIAMLLQNDPNKERNYIKLAEIREDLGDWLGAIGTYNNLGLLYMNLKAYDKSRKSFLTSYNLASSYGFRTDLIIAQRGLAISNYHLGNIDKAFKHFIEYDSLAWEWLHSEDYENKILELETKYKTAEIEHDNVLKQTEIERNQFKLTILYFVIGLVVIIAISGYLFLDQRRKRLKLDALRKEELTKQKIQALLQQQEIKTAYALLEGQDKERKRIATELHDNLGNILVTLNLYADTLLHKSKSDEVKDLVNRISDTSKNANEEVRKISHRLDSGLLKHFGLKAALSQLMEAVEVSKNIIITLELHLEETFTNEIGLQVYRIVQELVTNSLKHSNCTAIRLEVNHVNHEMNLIYEDNGKGFDTQQMRKGIGINNIQQRIEQLNGDFKIDSLIGRGSTFIMEIPVSS